MSPLWLVLAAASLAQAAAPSRTPVPLPGESGSAPVPVPVVGREISGGIGSDGIVPSVESSLAGLSGPDESPVLSPEMPSALPSPLPDTPALDPDALAAVRREMAERPILAPSLVQQYMAQVYHRYPEQGSSSAYAHYIQPLRDLRSKRMLHALLIYAGGHPEHMQSLPYEQARDHVVEAANRLSHQHDPEDPSELSMAIGLYLAELDDLSSRLLPGASPDNAVSREESPTPNRPESAPPPSVGLDYFPGWPEITERYGNLLRGGRMRLVKDEGSARRPHNEKSYQIYLDQEAVGRFTIRRYADHVERNILFMENGRMASFGRSDGPTEDLIRRAQQQATRLWDRIRRRSDP